ncbi:flagellin [Bacillus sp. RAR_GA_16]|uniref:flagellin N-terminal helical domain-containing protein n=1 Tax=Bacillus sp. RAR_GA_16 TaxID=2876774 RepID=UPI001CCB1F95|nr:flagellin [Bacillus sp. RAR_GA_16]MCA0174021.1 VWA domain-containing protein [Bacillus sp. RAR_GA_16]
MNISFNGAGLTSYNNMLKHSKQTAKSMNRIASGIKINSAGDDAAGLSITQKMKTQIRGLETANRNIQTGINLVATAEAGLELIENPNLLRMKELTIQAANDTLSAADKKAIQSEIDQIKEGINDLANQTSFSKINLLNVPEVQKVSPQSGGLPGQADIVFVVDNTGSMNTIQREVAQNVASFYEELDSHGVSDVRVGIMEFWDDQFSSKKFGGSLWSSDSAEIEDVLGNFPNRSAGTENTMTAIEHVVNNYDFRDNGETGSIKHIVLVTNEPGDDLSKLQATKDILNDKAIVVHGVYSSAPQLADLINSRQGTSVDLSSSNWGKELSTKLAKGIGELASEERYESTSLTLQVGPNSGDTYHIALTDATTEALGIDKVVIDPWEEAMETLKKVDNAIDRVLSERGKFGSCQNELERITQINKTTSMNLTAAASRIEDADLAEEAMKLAKSSILNQSAEAMLLQANQQAGEVLNLLK